MNDDLITNLHPAFAGALEADRLELNQRFKLCSSQGTPLDAAAFKEHLVTRVQPTVVAVAEQFPERARLATKELYMVSLELFRAGYWGTESRLPELNRLWVDVLPRLAQLVAREPERVSGSLSNALVNLAKHPVRLEQWLQELPDVGALCETVSQLLDVGLVLAWRSGLALLRSQALTIVNNLPRPIAQRALALSSAPSKEAWQSILDQLSNDPWFDPALPQSSGKPRIQEQFRVGDYRGLGGSFCDVPRVFADDGKLLVTDKTTVWEIVVDRFGCILQPRPGAATKGKLRKPRFPAIDIDGTIFWDDHEQRIEYIAESLSHASEGRTLAVTLESSFHVYILALVGNAG